ncbi:hypothetical protein [Kriegella aquimaris]|nr:hypothetical protein [Kriegella aquimaris]
MKFTAYKYQIIKDKPSITKQLFWTGLLMFGLVFGLLYLNNKMPVFENIQNLTLSFFLIACIPFISSYIYQYYDYERIDNIKDGHIEFNEDEIIIDYSRNYKYHELTDLQIGIIAYYGQRINLIYSNPNETKSLGIRNQLGISNKFEVLSFNFKLESETHLKELENTLFELVISGKLENIDSKKSIKLVSDRFKQNESYKNYVIKQILDKKIGCTEGLLLHGYKSDKEAKELRKKYCG